MSDLKLCPFCGVGKFRRINIYGYTGQIMMPPHYACNNSNCGVHVTWYPDGSIYYGIDSRPLEDALEAEIDRLEAENQRLRKSVIHLSAGLDDAVGFIRASAYELMHDYDMYNMPGLPDTMLCAAKELEDNRREYRAVLREPNNGHDTGNEEDDD